MAILDAYAVLAMLRDEPAAGQVEELIRGNDATILTAVGVAEVIDRIIRLNKVSEDEAVLDLAQLGLSDPDDLGPATALRAGLLRARHYHRRTCAVSLADCIAAETARETSQALATSDPHLLDLCTSERITVIVLPDSSGQTWRQPN